MATHTGTFPNIFLSADDRFLVPRPPPFAFILIIRNSSVFMHSVCRDARTSIPSRGVEQICRANTIRLPTEYSDRISRAEFGRSFRSFFFFFSFALRASIMQDENTCASPIACTQHTQTATSPVERKAVRIE